MVKLLYLVFCGTLVAVMEINGLSGPTAHSETRAVGSHAAVLWSSHDNLPGFIQQLLQSRAGQSITVLVKEGHKVQMVKKYFDNLRISSVVLNT